jgi:hypothetical protein
LNDETPAVEEVRDQRLRAIWRQREIPTVVRTHKTPRVLVTLPEDPANAQGKTDERGAATVDAWLRGEHRHRPRWDSRFRCRSVPKSWFDDMIERLLRRYGRVYVIQPYQEQQKCAPACWNAQGHICECSCLGANHGAGHPGSDWREITETFAFQWGPGHYGCRLLQSDTGPGVPPPSVLAGSAQHPHAPSRGRIAARSSRPAPSAASSLNVLPGRRP